MADVQIDDGNFTQIANVLLEKVSSSKLNGCQHAIVLLVWRYTYGFKRKEHDISSGFISTGTGYNKRQIEREIKVLVTRKIIIQKVINGVARNLSFNKDFDSWDTPGELADGQEADGEYTDGQEADTPPADKPTVTPGELADQERKSFKDNSKEIPYKDIVEYLNLKAGTDFKHSTKATQKHISGRWNEGHGLEAFKIVIDKKCAEWKEKPSMCQYLRPQTLFNSEKFESYLNQPIVLKGGATHGHVNGNSGSVQQHTEPETDWNKFVYRGSPRGNVLLPDMSNGN